MQVKLRKIGNSVGMTIPANELRAFSANVGDILDVEIRGVIHQKREGWDDPSMWTGAKEDELLIDDTLSNDFETEEWEW